MSLSDRLRGILKTTTTSTSPPSVSHSLDERRADARGAKSLALDTAVGGRWCDTNTGRCVVVERRVDPGACHGSQSVGGFAETIAGEVERLKFFARSTGASAPLLFFDLETTGLSGGAATCAFLIGVGWFDAAGAFVTRQYLLPDIRDERALLEQAGARFADAGTLVSFNGKSFDAPLLEMRCAYHRLPWVGGGLPHLDMLHPARRFWARALVDGTCSLTTLERQQLGAGRVNDVPGCEIPARYFRYVRTGDAAPLDAVLEHNRRDLLSLAGITATLLRLFANGPDAMSDAWCALALARTYVDAGEDQAARQAFRRAVQLSQGEPCFRSDVRIDALRGLAVAERRARNFGGAAECWTRVLEEPACPPHVAREAAEALAVHHEHRARDLTAARAFAMRSLQGSVGLKWNQAVEHRLSRLDRKMQRLEPAAATLWSHPPQGA